jgi:molecular chaperone DnaK
VQVEVTFNIDADGILNVTAKEKATGEEQSIKITASSGLTEDKVNRIVNDALSHATEDKQKRELVEQRNQADQLIHTMQTLMASLSDNQQAEFNTLIEQLKNRKPNSRSSIKAVQPMMTLLMLTLKR